MPKISLEQIMGGGLQEQFAKSFGRVLENLADPNTSYKDARKITIELKFAQNEARDDVACAVSVKEKLATQAPMQTMFAIGKNLKTGQMYAEEYGKHQQIKGQTSFEDAESVPVDPETGEVLEDAPASNSSVVDLRKFMAN